MSPVSTNSLLLGNARIICPDRVVEQGSVLIESGRIVEASDSRTRPSLAGTAAIEIPGLTLFPGFIDVHIHGAVDVDVMEASPADLNKISGFLASQGVTSWLPTFVPASDSTYASAINVIGKGIENEEASGARVLGVHYEGPFVNSAQCGALHTEHFKTYSSPADLEGLPAPENFVRLITLAPEIAGGVELVSELRSRGWVISIGHTRAAVDTLELAFAAGARHMTHFMNAMVPLHHRNPGPIGWGLSRDDVTCDIIADGIHLDKFVLQMLLKLKGAKGLALISDAIAAAGLGDGEYPIWGETIRVENGRTSNVHGSIAGSVITMLDAFRLMRSLGATDIELAQMASTNPAKLLKLDHECGSIEEGKRADLVAIDSDGKVQLTLVGGDVAFRV